RAQDLEQVYQATSEHLTAATLRELEETVSMRVMVLLNITDPHPEAESLTVEYQWASDKDADFPLVVGEQVAQSDLDFGGFAYSGTTIIKNIEEELQNTPALQHFLAYGGAKGAIVIPTSSRQKWFGVVIITYERSAEMSEQYVRFVNAVVDQLAIAVENQQLFIEAQMEARRAQVEARRALALAEAGQLASQVSSDFTIEMGDVVARVAESAGYNRWTLLLTENGQLQREVVTSPLMKERDVSELLDQIRELNLSLSQAYSNNETLIVNDLSEITLQDPATIADWDDIVEHYGKHIAVPIPGPAGQPIGALLVGRDLDEEDLDERDAQFAQTLASQIGVALENRRLFQQAERERRQLSQILSTLPAGVIVLDPQSLKPIMYNDLAEELLGGAIEYDEPFDPQRYHIHRTGTLQPYPADELPIFMALHSNTQAMADDIAIVDEASGIQTDIIINAAPIHNVEGGITAIVAAMQDISNLRMLENTLQENLRETVTLTKAQRALSEAANVDEVLDVLVLQLMMQQPDNALIVINTDNGPQIAREGIPTGLDNHHIAPFVDALVPLQGEIVRQLEDESLRMDWLNTGYHSIMSLPLRARSEGGTLGWIVLLSKSEERLSPEANRIYSQIADVAATTLDNRQLFLSTQIALQETARLYRATTSISRARDLLQLNEALQEALEGLEPDYYAGYIVNNDKIDVLFNKAMNDEAPLDFASLLRYELPQEDGVFISNTKEGTLTPLEMAVAKLGTVASLGTVNLRVQGVPSGRLFVAFKKPHQFTEGETRLLNAVADSASVVIDNQILFEQIQNTLEETSVLYQASRAMTEAHTPEDILDVAVNFVVGEGVNQVLIMMLSGPSWDSPSATAQVVAGWHQEGLALTGITLTPDQFPAWPLLTSRSVTAINDIHNDPTLDEMQISSIESLDARSVIIIPLRVTNRDIGIVWVSSRNAMQVSDRDIRLYQAFQEQASLAMEAAYLLQQAERRARQLETSAEVSQSAARILGLDTLLPELVDLIKEAFGYDHVQIFLMNEETDYAELKASTGEAGKKLLEIKHQLKRGSDSVIGKVTETGEPQIASDTADANVVHKPNPYLPMTRSEMAIPLIIQGRVVGALDVQSNKPNAFTEEDIRVLKTLAAQISVAIDNANLYEEAQRRASEMSFLFDITTAAAAAETLHEALEVVAERLYDSLEAQLVTVYLPHEYIDEITQETFTMVEPIAGAGLQQPLSELSEVRVNDPNNLIGIATANLQPEIIYDIGKEVRYIPISAEAKSAILVPISSGMQLIGLIVMESQRRNAFDYDTLQLLLAMAGSLAAIIQNAVLLEQLQETNEQLLELDRMKSAFLANMSHELRTPLNSIIGFSRVMLKGISGPLTEMQKQDLETIFNSGQHLLMLINDLLDQAKIAANKMELKFEYFDVGPLVEAVKSIALGLLKEKPVKLIVDMAPNLPQAYGDEFRTRQVLLNLVNNAVKFTPEGSITISVYLVENPQTGAPMIRIDVTDTGIGIAEKDLPLLFEAFRQVDSSLTRTVGGTGLGLPIAKSLTEMQGGELTVQSELNVGSTFSITIPTEPTVDEGTEEEEQEENQEQTPDASANGDGGNGAQPPRQNGKKRLPHQAGRIMTRKREVLLIEDDKNMVDQFRRLLQREGFEVQTADHPAYAEAMASNLRPTVIILDVNFAEGQGWSILERLKDRDDTFDIPIVVVTLDSDSERAYQKGAHTFIQRPFDPEQLVQSVLDAEKESNRERILIIDDKPDSVRLIIQTLKEHGNYRVFTADNGHDGIALVARRRPDLILLDLRMPDKDGFEVLQELRSNPETADIPVVVITGEDELSSEEQALLDGVGVVYKSAVSKEEYDAFLKQVKEYLQAKKG
ncbi:MAG: GAF domain-containing protein, partial [Chloroflexi bacterium]